ncbi:MAG: hypothetical protein PWR10_2340 [Halanaerobiales bacterium]|nr:hypothetical protein [Halanaerobiales bacterium]
MKGYRSKKIPILLVVVLLVNFLTFGFLGSTRVEASFWSDHKGSVLTVIKGLVMLWILNLMIDNTTGGGSDDLITSTIKKGLNLDLNDTVNNKDSKQINDNPEEISRQKDEVVIVENPELNSEGLTDKESKMIELVNQIRREKGLNTLKIDLQLVELARKKARDMIRNKYFAHQSPTFGSPFEMLKEEGIQYSLAGENLAGARTVEKAFSSLMESPEHRDNILMSRYDKIGVGIIEGGPYGLMIVQLFIDSPDPAV